MLLTGKFSWLLFGMRTLPVGASYVGSKTIIKAQHCCLLRVKELSLGILHFLLSLLIHKSAFGIST